MRNYIHNLALSTTSHHVRSKTSEIFKVSTYVSLFVVLSIFSSGTSSAKTVCTTEVIKDENSPTLSPDMLDALSEAISANTFILDEPYTVITKKKGCSGEDDTQSVTQTRSDGTRTWTYTFIDEAWLLTGYKHALTASEAP
ncbi:hypothetical protein CWI80_00205 [Pseudidiomarina sediminum]|uniref:Uncharacterized protein n=1 Tax=Pseudidiomarina sediminum TaxID=431675 RepID=A0A432Z7G2_9GAMM|nr:hypothetical protein [Pseudidiomarina sediminum]RUO73826.1 hypothetical protein CWI80_00205 [Pseudidiomarina sediminum]